MFPCAINVHSEEAKNKDHITKLDIFDFFFKQNFKPLVFMYIPGTARVLQCGDCPVALEPGPGRVRR